MTNQQFVYVLDKDKNPLMPMATARFGRVRKLLKEGKAKIVKRKPFTIQLLYDSTTHKQALILGNDPGSKHPGAIVRTERNKIVYAAHLTTRTKEVTKEMMDRGMHRAARRRNRRDKRKRRAHLAGTTFEGGKEYQLSQMSKIITCTSMQSHQNFIKHIAGFLPISKVYVEYNDFDIAKINDSTIAGLQYQNGRMKGASNVVQYVLARDKHTCQRCKKGHGVELQVHHVIRRGKGADTPENLITLCKPCHDKLHKNVKIEKQVTAKFKGMKKEHVHTTLLNTIMPSYYQWLVENFPMVLKTYGYETKFKRKTLDVEKKHFIDAYLTTIENGDLAKVNIDFDDVHVFYYTQFRRHNRALTNQVKDRHYIMGKKTIIAWNRNKRTGQTKPSLAEMTAEHGEKYHHTFTLVRPGDRVIKCGYNTIGRGDLVEYKGQHYIVSGHSKGVKIELYGEYKNRISAGVKKCRLVMKNTGMVVI